MPDIRTITTATLLTGEDLPPKSGAVKTAVDALDADITAVEADVATIETATVGIEQIDNSKTLWGTDEGISLISLDNDGKIIVDLSDKSIPNIINSSVFSAAVDTAVDTAVATIESDITAIETNIDTVEADITAIETDITAIESDIAAIETDIATLETATDGIEQIDNSKTLWGTDEGISLISLDNDGKILIDISDKSIGDIIAAVQDDIETAVDTAIDAEYPSPNIFILGDSMTTESFRASIASNLGGRTVSVLQRGGADALALSIAMGASPLYVTLTSNAIPASGGVVVTSRTRNILSSGGTNSGTFRCSISGIFGLVTTDGAGVWTFTRDTNGSETAVTADVQAILDPTTGTASIPATNTYRARTAIFRLGRNGARSTRAETNITLNALRDSIKFLTPRVKRVIILSPYNGRAKDHSTGNDHEPSGSTNYNQMMTLIEEMKREFPLQFVDMRSWAVKNAIYDQALTPTSDDLADMALDCIPRQLFSSGDNTHVNTAMQTAEGLFVAKILTALNW